MKTTGLRLLATVLLAGGIATPAFSQTKGPSTTFAKTLCEIDLRVLGLPAFQQSEFTFVSRKLCSGVASARNAKLECEGTIPNWTLGDRSAKNFDCQVFGDVCGITPKLVTTKITSLTVSSAGKAKLSCSVKPPLQ